MKKNFTVKESFNNFRLDKWFRKNVCDVPQSLIEKSIRKGKIKVNKKTKKSSYRITKNDIITIYDINFKLDKNKKRKEKYIATKSDISSTSSIFIENNENFVVINKPAGIAVQSGTKSKRNILDILRNTKEFDGTTPYTVHRIDKETTGILIFAKNRKYAQLFTSLFRIRKIYKTYLGIVLGEMQNKRGTLKHELIYFEGNNKIKVLAITHYVVLDSNGKYSLLQLNPETGRKHQIRKQLLIHGNPILGDTKYRISSSTVNKKSNLMLHAYKIKFSINDVKFNFSAETPKIFKQTLKEKYLKIY